MLINELKEKIEMLDKAIERQVYLGTDWCKKKYTYKTAMYKRIMEERANKTPVSILSKICQCSPDIAVIEMEENISEVLYKAEQERINALKIQIKTINDQISREWSQAGRTR